MITRLEMQQTAYDALQSRAMRLTVKRCHETPPDRRRTSCAACGSKKRSECLAMQVRARTGLLGGDRRAPVTGPRVAFERLPIPEGAKNGK